MDSLGRTATGDGSRRGQPRRRRRGHIQGRVPTPPRENIPHENTKQKSFCSPGELRDDLGKNRRNAAEGEENYYLFALTYMLLVSIYFYRLVTN